MIKIQHYTTLEENFLKEWLSLWEKSTDANYTNSPLWFLASRKTFNYKQYKIIAIYKKTQLVSVGAFIQEKKYGIDMYSTPPKDFVYGFPFLLDIKDKELVGIFVHELVKLGTIFLENIPEELIRALQSNTSQMSASVSSVNYHMQIEKNENDEIIILNRKKLLYRSKKNEEKFTLLSYTGDVPEAIEIAFAIDNQSRKQSRGYNAFADKNIQEFYRNLGIEFGKYFSINILHFENKPIAYRIGFIINKIFFASQIAFLAEYGLYSPGNVLLIKFMEKFGKNEINKIDFGSGDNYFKRSFTKTSQPLYTVVISKNFFVRNLVTMIYKEKDILFNKIHTHVKIYQLYKNIKKIIKI